MGLQGGSSGGPTGAVSPSNEDEAAGGNKEAPVVNWGGDGDSPQQRGGSRWWCDARPHTHEVSERRMRHRGDGGCSTYTMPVRVVERRIRTWILSTTC
jgi:hypothetical protein